MDAARRKGSGYGGQGRQEHESRNRVAARTMDQQRNQAGGPLGLVKRKLKKVCALYCLSILKSPYLQTSELIDLLVIGCSLSADY